MFLFSIKSKSRKITDDFFLLQSNENLKKKKISINIQIKLILFLFCSVNKMKQKEKNNWNWNVISRTTAIGDNHLSIKIFVFAKKISAVISTKDGISKQSSNSSLISCSHFFFFVILRKVKLFLHHTQIIKIKYSCQESQ